MSGGETGNSSPFAFGRSSVGRRSGSPPPQDRRLSGVACGCLRLERVDESPKRHPALYFVLPRELGHVEHVSQRLLTGRSQHESDVCARVGQKGRRGSATGLCSVAGGAWQKLQCPRTGVSRGGSESWMRNG